MYLLKQLDLAADYTPKAIAAKNIEVYKKLTIKFILQGGEKHETTGHSFNLKTNYETAINLNAIRVFSCNTTSILRTLSALKRAGLMYYVPRTLLRRATDHLGESPWRDCEYHAALKRDTESPWS